MSEMIKYDSIIVGNNIFFMRRKMNYSREYVADKLGISPAQLGKIERGEANITTEKLFMLARILETDPNHILSYTEDGVIEGTICIDAKDLISGIDSDKKVLSLVIKAGD